MDKNVRDLHKKGMSKLRTLVQMNVLLKYEDDSMVYVPCTISDERTEMLKYSQYIGKNAKIFNVIVDDLIDKEAPIIGFNYVYYNNRDYQVQSIIKNGIFDNTISLIAVLFEGDMNK